jgi:hypothetical protein
MLNGAPLALVTSLRIRQMKSTLALSNLVPVPPFALPRSVRGYVATREA